MAHGALAGLAMDLLDLHCLRAPGTNDLEFHVKAPFKKEKGDRALMNELRPPCVFVCVVTVYLENTASLQLGVQ